MISFLLLNTASSSSSYLEKYQSFGYNNLTVVAPPGFRLSLPLFFVLVILIFIRLPFSDFGLFIIGLFFLSISVTRFGEISPLRHKFTGLLIVWQNPEPTLANM